VNAELDELTEGLSAAESAARRRPSGGRQFSQSGRPDKLPARASVTGSAICPKAAKPAILQSVKAIPAHLTLK
jgi:hypothetical protein